MYKAPSLMALSLISTMCVSSAYAAKPVNLRHQPVSAIQAFAGPGLSALKETSSHVDMNHITHIRIQQTYGNVPVWGADAVLHVPAGGNTSLGALDPGTSMNGVLFDSLTQDLGPVPASLMTHEQQQKALMQGVWLHEQATGIKQHDVHSEKVYPIIYMDKDNKAHYAYYVSFYTGKADGTPTVPTYILDAASLTVHEQFDNLQSLDNVSAGGYGGNPKMGKIVFSGQQGDYPSLAISRNANKRLCLLKNDDVEVKDDTNASGPISSTHSERFNCAKPDAHYKIFWNADQDAVNGGYSPANDAMYIGTVVKNLYQQWYNVPVLARFGIPLKLVLHVHAKDLFGNKMDNAFFFPITNQMYFGDGVKLFYPLTSLGVGAHELSHGFTSQHSNLAYEKQSGGLNESYSDMAAQAAEFYSTGKNSWQIGPEIVIGEGALRYMDHPTKDGHSIGHMRAYNDDLNVHYTSGIFNKVFYLLSTSPDWDTRKAFDVMVKANMDYWTSKTTFKEAACGVFNATQDYHYQSEAVALAMHQVGLNVRNC